MAVSLPFRFCQHRTPVQSLPCTFPGALESFSIVSSIFFCAHTQAVYLKGRQLIAPGKPSTILGQSYEILESTDGTRGAKQQT